MTDKDTWKKIISAVIAILQALLNTVLQKGKAVKAKINKH